MKFFFAGSREISREGEEFHKAAERTGRAQPYVILASHSEASRNKGTRCNAEWILTKARTGSLGLGRLGAASCVALCTIVYFLIGATADFLCRESVNEIRCTTRNIKCS